MIFKMAEEEDAIQEEETNYLQNRKLVPPNHYTLVRYGNISGLKKAIVIRNSYYVVCVEQS